MKTSCSLPRQDFVNCYIPCFMRTFYNENVWKHPTLYQAGTACKKGYIADGKRIMQEYASKCSESMRVQVRANIFLLSLHKSFIISLLYIGWEHESTMMYNLSLLMLSVCCRPNVYSIPIIEIKIRKTHKRRNPLSFPSLLLPNILYFAFTNYSIRARVQAGWTRSSYFPQRKYDCKGFLSFIPVW